MGTGRILASNSKSEVRLDEGGVCVKRYLTADAVGRIEQDQKSLTRLSETVPTLTVSGWEARTVRPLWVAVDRRSLGMEHVHGSSLADLGPQALARAEFLYGAWIAHFHRHMHGGARYGPLYTDLNLHNAVLDEAGCRLVILDPGNQFGREGSVYEDLVQHIHSLVVTCIRRFRNPLPHIRSFLSGYRTGDQTFSVVSYAGGVARAHYRAVRGLASSRPARLPALLVTSIAMVPIYFAYIPAKLIRPPHTERAETRA